MKPIVVMTWPKHCDFPVARYNLKRFRKYFQDIYIAFSFHHFEDDYSNFIRSDLDAHYIDAQRTENGDWRDDAVNQLLDILPPSEHILFLEQDFLIANDNFFEKLFNQDHDFIYYEENERIHPAFAAVKTEIVHKTHRDFSAVPPQDHFGRFFEEVKLYTDGENIESLGVKWKEDFYHMQGVTQNYKNFQFQDPFFRPNTFFYFNWKSTLLPDQSPFCNIMKQINAFPRPKQHEFLDNFFPYVQT